ncbi:uncharacterized protein VP01_170g6 [Puccinia sorghi]|uniref:CCHC-type domain-containing protein n=1 Tax=Puccinia sorghi TaxID=27349 RepID=A0A0L6VFG6_9BASI|nr:uncharacterized protein VP01_170g6 [Puccinia sorghi]
MNFQKKIHNNLKVQSELYLNQSFLNEIKRMSIPKRGKLMSEVYNRPVFYYGISWKIFIGLTESWHFMVLKMKDDNLFPVAQLEKNWEHIATPEAMKWKNRYLRCFELNQRLKLETEETLQQTHARLDATAGQQNPTPAQPNPPASNPMVLAKPQPFDGTCSSTTKAFFGQIGLHAMTYPKRFSTNASKVVFAILFMKDYTATWSQLYLDKVFNGEPVVFNDFLNDFKPSFFDHNRQHCVKVALQNLCQTGTVSAYTQEFNSQARTIGWANAPLMSLYQHGLKMANPPPSPLAPVPQPPTPMQWTSQPSNVLKLCFCCGQAGHISCGCSNGNRKLFLSLLISVSNIPRATFTPSFLIDSGATHNILSDCHALSHPNQTKH